MGRDRRYESDAARQAAYRARRKFRRSLARVTTEQVDAWRLDAWRPPNLTALEEAVATPTWDKLQSFCVTDAVRRCIEAAVQLSTRQRVVVIFLAGDPGIGKSSLAAWTAATFQRRFVAVNCPLIKHRNDWFFSRELMDRRTVSYPTPFVHALMLGGAVILLDEVNRIEPSLIGPLNSFLDDQYGAYIHELGRRVEVNWSTLIFLTANENSGGRRDFAGTYPIDHSLRDRCDLKIELTAPDAVTMRQILQQRTGCTRVQAERIVWIREAINGPHGDDQDPDVHLRKVGTRALLRVANLVVSGLPLPEACQVAIMNDYNAEGGTDSPRYRVAEIIKGVLGPRG
jgi:hypothetical protein